MAKNEVYTKFKEEGKILEGTVALAFNTKYKGYDVSAVKVVPDDDKNNNNIVILSQDMFLPRNTRPVKDMVGEKIKFRIKDVRTKKIYGERASVLEDEKKKFVEDGTKEPDKVYKATIKKILEQGAFLSINDMPVFMYNSGFALGYIPISVVKKVGDVVEVQYHKYNPNTGVIYVKMKDKYKEEMTVKVEELKPQDILKGVIRTKTSNLCFVNVAPMIDVLCSPILGADVGDEVFVKVTGYREVDDQIRARGKIVVQEYSDDFKL